MKKTILLITIFSILSSFLVFGGLIPCDYTVGTDPNIGCIDTNEDGNWDAQCDRTSGSTVFSAVAGTICDSGTIPGPTTPTDCYGCQIPTTDNTGACMPLAHRIQNQDISDILDPSSTELVPAYCGLDITGPAWIAQKQGNIACDNAYECESYQCVGGTCIDIQQVQRERSFVQKLFCKIATWGPISYKGWTDEQQCLNYLERSCESNADCSKYGTGWVCHDEDEYCVACQYHTDCSAGEICFGDGCMGCQTSSFCYKYYAELDYENLPAGWETRWATGDDLSEYIYCSIPTGVEGTCVDACTSDNQCADLYAFEFADGPVCDTATGDCVPASA